MNWETCAWLTSKLDFLLDMMGNTITRFHPKSTGEHFSYESLIRTHDILLASVWCTSLRQSIQRGRQFYIFNCIDYMNIYIYIVLCSLGSINSIIKFIIILYTPYQWLPPPISQMRLADYLWNCLLKLLSYNHHLIIL